MTLVLLSAAGAGLRFATLGTQSFWLDEAVTGRLMRLSFWGMIERIPASESTPPLYDVLAWSWTRVFGVNEVGLRSLSAVFGTLTIPVVYAAASRLFDPRTARFAAALAAFSPLLVWYSQEARAYALLVLLVGGTVWACAGVRERAPRALPAWAILGALALATHYFAVFVVLPEAMWILWRRRRAGAIAAAIPGALGLALLGLALHQRARGSAHFIADSGLARRLAQVPKQIVVGYDAPAGIWLAVLGGLFTLAILASGSRRLRRSDSWPAVLSLGGLIVLGLGLPLGLALVGSDYLITRNVIAVSVPWCLLVAALGARSTWGRWLVGSLCAVGMSAGVAIAADVHYQRDDWRAAVRGVVPGVPTGLVVTPASGRAAVEYYVRGARPFPGGGALVRSLRLIALGERRSARGVAAPRLAPPPPLAGFDKPLVASGPTYVTYTYRSLLPAGVIVGESVLRALDVSGEAATTLLVG